MASRPGKDGDQATGRVRRVFFDRDQAVDARGRCRATARTRSGVTQDTTRSPRNRAATFSKVPITVSGGTRIK